MVRNKGMSTNLVYKYYDEDSSDAVCSDVIEPTNEKLTVKSYSVLFFLYVHLVAVYGLYLGITSAKMATILFAVTINILGRLGVTAGAHRLWSHRAYKAKPPLQILLIFFYLFTFQKSLLTWCRDHRVHHKFTDTDADPHNIKRGFFFSQIGWLFVKRHSKYKEKAKDIDLSDLTSNPFVAFQHKYYYYIAPIVAIILPTLIPMILWNELFDNAFCINVLQFVYSLHIVGLVNSIAHLWGSKPFDRFISPVDNRAIALLAVGEGFHNYHHAFPWDYKTSEYGKNALNWAAVFIELFAKIGWAYDLRIASNKMIRARILRTGDHEMWGMEEKNQSKE